MDNRLITAKDMMITGYVQIIPNKYDCPICGRKGIYKDKYRRELCMKCKMIAKRTGRYIG